LKYSVDVFQVLKVESVSIYKMLKFFTTVYKIEKYNEKKCFQKYILSSRALTGQYDIFFGFN